MHSLEAPRVGVGVLLRRGSDVLLMRRANTHGAGNWSTPGGHLDPGESPDACAVREVREEVGLAIDGVRFLGMTNDVFEEEKRHYITLWMEAEVTVGTASIRAAHEMSELAWFPAASLPSELFLSLRHLIDGAGYGVDPTRIADLDSDRRNGTLR